MDPASAARLEALFSGAAPAAPAGANGGHKPGA